MICALCMYDPKPHFHEAKEPITILHGYAVCEDHVSFLAQGPEWALIMNSLRR